MARRNSGPTPPAAATPVVPLLLIALTIGLCVWAFCDARLWHPSGRRVGWSWEWLSAPAQALPQYAPRFAFLMAKLLFFWTAAWSLGTRLLSFFRLDGLDALEKRLLEAGLGAGALSLAGLALGLAGMSRPALLLALMVLLFAAAAAPLLRARSEGPPTAPRDGWRPPPVAATALCFFAAYVLLMAGGPAKSYDSLVYHLALPDLFLLRGRITPEPFNAYAGFPQGVEMLYLWALTLDGSGSLCQMLHCSLGLLAAASIGALGRRLGSREAGVWGAAFFLTSPMVLLSSVKPDTELCWALYLALSCFCLVVAEGRRSWLVLGGVFVGLALGTKYLAVTLPPAVFVLLGLRRGREGLKEALLACAVAVAVASPWALKNVVLYGDPVHPFLAPLLGRPGLIDTTALRGASLPRDPVAALTTAAGAKELAVSSWRMWFYDPDVPVDNTPSLAYPLALSGLLLGVSSPWAGPLAGFFGALALPIHLGSRMVRFNIPAFVPLSLLAGLAVSGARGWGRAVVSALAAAVFILNGLFSFTRLDTAAYWKAAPGGPAIHEFLARTHSGYPTPVYRLIAWSNAYLPADAKILFVCHSRPFPLRRDRLSSSEYAAEPLALFAGAAASPDDLAARLRREGFTHVLINGAECVRAGRRLSPPPRTRLLLASFWTSWLDEVAVDANRTPGDLRAAALLALRPQARKPGDPAASVFPERLLLAPGAAAPK